MMQFRIILITALLSIFFNGCMPVYNKHDDFGYRARGAKRFLEYTKWSRKFDLYTTTKDGGEKAITVKQRLSIADNEILLRTWINDREYRKRFNYRMKRGDIVARLQKNGAENLVYEYDRDGEYLEISTGWGDDSLPDDIIFEIAGEWGFRGPRIRKVYYRYYYPYYPPRPVYTYRDRRPAAMTRSEGPDCIMKVKPKKEKYRKRGKVKY